MNIYKYLVVASGMILIVASACVPARKYEELQAKEAACSDSLSAVNGRYKDIFAKYKDLQTEFDRIKREHELLTRDTTVLSQSYRHLKTQYDHIDRNNKRIQEQLETLRKELERESQQLGTELEKKKAELIKLEDELDKLAKDLEALSKKLEEKEKLLELREKRVNELEDLLKKKDEATLALKNKISEALLSFKDKGLTVEERNGKIYVSMEAKLLFASGSIKVEDEGATAIVELAKVLQEQKDLEIIVEGHTDTDKLKSTSHPKDNWELSVLRATSVVKIMTENSQMDPRQLTAAGRSEFIPVDATDKAKNRRIEIIIMPNLDELYKIIEQD